MKIHVYFLLAGVMAPALAAWLLGGAGAGEAADTERKPILTGATLAELVKETAAMIRNDLNGRDSPKVMGAKVKTNALIIAVAAQNGMASSAADAKHLATLRDAALKLAQTVGAGKINVSEAKKQVELIVQFPDLTADSDAKPRIVALKHKFDLDEVMNVFAKTEKGGLGIEKDLINLGTQKRPYSPAQMSPKLMLAAYKTAVLADLVDEHIESAKDNAKDKKKDWQTSSQDMRTSAIELAEAVKSKNAKAAKTAVNKLNTSCNACHGLFRQGTTLR